ncbi:MAG: hypothetical protein B7Y99_10000 [Caulobacterales bacterium 32-69-10]|nr:MAG: hypothetical protein B7Y99_10000 [Caulobacterales bacterium 32-69-10]
MCDDESYSLHLLDRLSDSGFGVLGPAPNAAIALALASQSRATVALVASQPRGAPELADSLMRTWGVRSLLLQDVSDADDFTAADWAAAPAQRDRLHRALGLAAVN